MSSMTVEAGGLSDISSRIEQIQSQLAALSGTTTTTSTDSTSSDFSTALRAATSSTSTTGVVATNDGSTIAPPPGYGTSSSGATGSDVVTDARRYLGVPYLWGGTDPSKGLDCSGLVQQVYGDLGISLPRVSRDQADTGTAVGSLADAQPGDLLFFGSPIHHVAIYEGNGMMIEAPHTGQSVKEIKVSDFGEPVSEIRRVLGTSADTSARVSTMTAVDTSAVDTNGAAGVGSATPYASVINAASARTGVPADLIAAVAKQESGFNAKAVSKAGAEGIMQLMPATAKGLGVTNPLDATQSINGGADYLASLLKRFGGSTTLAVAAYNAGPGAVLKYGGVPPYSETQNYVRNVLALTEAS
ncbi:transglycosylase SLT domain-containing protein [Nocardioides sp. Iso805N]|uniref:transglycosylase SLT domain-containing protein n=1 Tax=Nocardioides sp. Iso805N TaxID=1283287 RepID=UPI001E48A3EA|nr:transglycosylase SLT domain-containing protein [Nocardioides sp. Iso805N]